jgi:hypothetical protein|tara:strand:- start:1091 stop:1429 length:339 start_codon:yes stop_codon:yes gene_type:complete
MASRANIYIDKGLDFRQSLELFNEAGVEYTDAEIQVYNFYSGIRKVYSSTAAVSFTVEKANNDITLILTDQQTDTLTPGKYQYDVVMEKQTGELTKIVEGLAIVVDTITEVS